MKKLLAFMDHLSEFFSKLEKLIVQIAVIILFSIGIFVLVIKKMEDFQKPFGAPIPNPVEFEQHKQTDNRKFLYYPFRSLPAEGPGSEGVRG